MQGLCIDLNDQYQEVDDRVSRLDEKTWFRPTPFYAWTIFDQIAHLALIDHEALLAIDDPTRFAVRAPAVAEMIHAHADACRRTREMLGVDGPSALMQYWRTHRTDLLKRLAGMDPSLRIRWYGPEMSARSFATARLMEAWAHGQDIFDALGLQRRNTDRLRHVAHLGVATFPWSFRVRNRQPPDFTPRVELTGPSGALWTWGAADAHEHVRGSAEDFCLVVTQRRHVSDTRLEYSGEHVSWWLAFAQAFAGAAQNPPAPGERAGRSGRYEEAG